VSRYQKGKTNLDFTEARDSEWQWHQLGHMKSARRSREITTPATHRSVFYRPDALPAAQPTALFHVTTRLLIQQKPESLHFHNPEAMHSHTPSVQHQHQQLKTNNTRKTEKNIQKNKSKCEQLSQKQTEECTESECIMYITKICIFPQNCHRTLKICIYFAIIQHD